MNNMTNTLNPRYRSIVSGAWTEFVLMVKDVRPRDSGTYECQVVLMMMVMNIMWSGLMMTIIYLFMIMVMIIIWSGVRAKTLQSPPHSAPYCDWLVLFIIIIKDKNIREKFKPIYGYRFQSNFNFTQMSHKLI